MTNPLFPEYVFTFCNRLTRGFLSSQLISESFYSWSDPIFFSAYFLNSTIKFFKTWSFFFLCTFRPLSVLVNNILKSLKIIWLFFQNFYMINTVNLQYFLLFFVIVFNRRLNVLLKGANSLFFENELKTLSDEKKLLESKVSFRLIQFHFLNKKALKINIDRKNALSEL